MMRTTGAFVIILLLASSAHAGTVALWLFDDSAGSGTALDSSGYDHHLSLGSAGAIQTGGKWGNQLVNTAGQAENLNGQIATLSDIDGTILNDTFSGSFTVEGWFRASPAPTGDIWSTLFRVGRTTGNWTDDTISIFLRAGNFFTIAMDGGDPIQTNPGSSMTDTWSHVALTYNHSTNEMVFFQNGLELVRQTLLNDPDAFGAAGDPTLDLLVDAEDSRAIFAFPGSADEVRISNSVLYTGNFSPPGTLAGSVLPSLDVSPTSLEFTTVEGQNPTARNITIGSNSPPMNWSIAESIDWLAFSPAAGQITGNSITVTVSVAADSLSLGTYNESFTIASPTADNSPVTIDVTLNVLEDTGAWIVGNRKQLFIDDRFIENSSNVTLTVNEAEPMGIALDSQNSPWQDIPFGYSRVIQEGDLIKLYYNGTAGLSYAESTDGLKFTRTPLGLINIGGHDTNIIMQGSHSPDSMIFVDPIAPPEQRYKLFDAEYDEGVIAYYSADGIHFTPAGNVWPLYAETGAIVVRDAKLNKYVMFTKMLNTTVDNVSHQSDYDKVRTMGGSDVSVGHEHLRAIGRVEIDNLLQEWPYTAGSVPSKIPTRHHIEMVMSADDQDPERVDFYTNGTTLYPYAEDVYLMFPNTFRHFSPSTHPWFGSSQDTNGPLDIQLAVSRDGVIWERPERGPYVRFGLGDESGRWMAMMYPGIARVGNYLYHYYRSNGALHSLYVWWPEYQNTVPMRSTIQVARQRLDGFVSADFDYSGASLTTPPIVFTGEELHLNLDTAASGHLFVEIRNANDQPISGFTLSDCWEVGGNFVSLKVRWNGNSDISSLAGAPIKIHIEGRDTKLYAFQFMGETQENAVGEKWVNYE